MDNSYVIIFLIIMLSLIYVEYNTQLFETKLFKLILFILIIYVASVNIVAAIIIAFTVLLLMQNIIGKNIDNEKENFELYLNNPLQSNDDLERLNNNINFSLETPDNLYFNMIDKGKKMVDASYELYNESIKDNNKELKNTSNDEFIQGSTLIQTGINRMQNNTNINDNDKFNYIVYENLLNNYSDNKNIMNTYKKLVNEYSNNKNIIYDDNHEFDNKMNNLYKIQFKLLTEVNNEIKNDAKNKAKINSQINVINNIISNKENNNNIEKHINILIKLMY